MALDGVMGWGGGGVVVKLSILHPGAIIGTEPTVTDLTA